MLGRLKACGRVRDFDSLGDYPCCNTQLASLVSRRAATDLHRGVLSRCTDGHSSESAWLLTLSWAFSCVGGQAVSPISRRQHGACACQPGCQAKTWNPVKPQTSNTWSPRSCTVFQCQGSNPEQVLFQASVWESFEPSCGYESHIIQPFADVEVFGFGSAGFIGCSRILQLPRHIRHEVFHLQASRPEFSAITVPDNSKGAAPKSSIGGAGAVADPLVVDNFLPFLQSIHLFVHWTGTAFAVFLLATAITRWFCTAGYIELATLAGPCEAAITHIQFAAFLLPSVLAYQISHDTIGRLHVTAMMVTAQAVITLCLGGALMHQLVPSRFVRRLGLTRLTTAILKGLGFAVVAGLDGAPGSRMCTTPRRRHNGRPDKKLSWFVKTWIAFVVAFCPSAPQRICIGIPGTWLLPATALFTQFGATAAMPPPEMTRPATDNRPEAYPEELPSVVGVDLLRRISATDIPEHSVFLRSGLRDTALLATMLQLLIRPL